MLKRLLRRKILKCEICGGTMKHVRTIAAARRLPELHTFKCRCGCMRTVEAESESEQRAASGGFAAASQ
jgi:hypothetical protein